MSIYAEARRRGVFKAAATYIVVSWLMLEVGYVLSTILGLPKPVMKTLLALLVLGFPLLIGFAWNFRMTGNGLFRHPELPETEPAAGMEHDLHEAGHEGGHGGHGGTVGGIDPLPIIVGFMVVGGLMILLVNKFMGVPEAEKPADGAVAAITTAAPATPAATAIAARPAAPNSIAVLPFDNLSGDPEQAYFSDGMAEELRSSLAGVAGLKVAARTSSNSFRGTSTDVATIAGKLGVAYTLEGSVRRAGKVIRVTAQLIEAKTGFERVSQTYDREAKDIFAIQSEIATKVTDALKVELLPQEAARISAGGTQSTVAHDAYLRGRQLFDLSGDEAVYRSALAQFDAAIATDPRYASAHAARGYTLAIIAGQFDPAQKFKATNAAALASARQGVALAPGLADTQLALGYVLGRTDFDLKGANTAYESALQAAPGDADVLISYGLFNVRVGDAAKGLVALEKAVELDRFNPRAWKALAGAYTATRRYPEALAHQRQALALSPGLAVGHYDMGLTLLMMGKPEEAKVEFGREKQSWARQTGLAIIAWKQGDKPTSDRLLAALVAENGDTALYQQAQVRAQRGDSAGALAALERALMIGDSGLLSLRNDPLLDPLRREPRFQRLLARMSV
ncbi:MAG: tetratricopeptide repeat protein [Polymorphobacter sp.]